jgi:hypothetical protein
LVKSKRRKSFTYRFDISGFFRVIVIPSNWTNTYIIGAKHCAARFAPIAD